MIDTILVIPAASIGDMRAFVAEQLGPIERAKVEFIAGPTGALQQLEIEQQTDAIIAALEASPLAGDCCMIMHHECRLSERRFRGHWKHQAGPASTFQVLHNLGIHKALKTRWATKRFQWKIKATDEAKKFEPNKANLDQWLLQFNALRIPLIGKKVAMRLEVVRLHELENQPFHSGPTDLIGQKRLHCFVQDSDRGGSWLSMQQILAKSHSDPDVAAIETGSANAELKARACEYDEVIIYEDGLWSGSETVKRLDLLSTIFPTTRIKLRFGIVTDFGLRVVRHAIREKGLAERIEVLAAGSRVQEFLPKELPPGIGMGTDLDHKSYFTSLHHHVTPFAFLETSDWSEVERDICYQLGFQLAHNWRRREENSEKAVKSAEKFALGGGGFASTMLFSTSVPKVCLPMLWLDGAVELNDQKLIWKPLFGDARRLEEKM